MVPLLKAYYILGTILVAEDIIVNKTNEVPCPDEANCLVGKKTTKINCIKFGALGASLVAQWLRICLPMQGTRVRALVWEDPTCRGATRPVSHNC